MSKFRDDLIGLPTRHGTATGDANERQMLDATGRLNNMSFVTRVRKCIGPEGQRGEVTLRTRGGMAEFTTRFDDVETPESFAAYMESGVLTNAGAFAPPDEASMPAKWRFANISPTEDWLGAIKSPRGVQKTSQPTPIDTHKLRDDIDSLAVGFPRSTDAVTDQENKLENYDKLIAKKLCFGLYQSGVFTGKFRLWMQAHYGAKLKKFKLRVSVNEAGTPFCHYVAKNKDDTETLWQLTHFAHNSVGLHVTSAFEYFMIRIEEVSGNRYQLTANKLKFTDSGKAILRKIKQYSKTGALTDDLRRKMEAYLFTESRIDVAASEVVGEVQCPGATGDALEYGWHFNASGSRASIVMHYQTGASPSQHFVAQEVHIDISRNGTSWSLSPTFSALTPWIDGWGVWHIFKPSGYHYDAELACFSNFYNGGAYRSTATFTNVPIYGYYDKDDQWIAIRVTQNGISSTPRYEYDYGSAYLAPTVTEANKQTDFWNVIFNSSVIRDDEDWLGYSYAYTNIKTNTLYVGTAAFEGEKADSLEREAGQSVSISYNTGDYYNPLVVNPSTYALLTTPKYAVRDFFIEHSARIYPSWVPLPPLIKQTTHPIGVLRWVMQPNELTRVGYKVERSGYYLKQWTLVIPPNESSAVLVMTRTWSNTTGTRYEGTRTSGHGQQGWNSPNYSYNWITSPGSVDPYGHRDFIWTNPDPVVDGTPIFEGAFERSVDVVGHLHNATVVGTPSGSYTSLFEVAYNNPIYNGTLSLQASFNTWYAGSEGMRNPTTLPGPAFVGWV